MAYIPIHEDVVKVHKGIEDINIILAYHSFLKNPQQQHIKRKQLFVGGFKMNECLIHYISLDSLLTTNHTQFSEQDLLIILMLLNHFTID